MDRPVLEAAEIRKVFKYPHRLEILKGVTLKVFRGESLAIMGASGEGKSTLLHILGTLEEATSGELTIAGKTAKRTLSPLLRSRHLGFVFQAFNLLEDYTALQNVLMPGLIAKVRIHKGSPCYRRALMLLEQVGLSQRAYFPTKLLSGGEKQRVALARALCNDPDVILADEPTGNLDHSTSQQVHTLLFDCVRSLQKTLIVVTHDHELARLCSRTLHLCDGILHERQLIEER